MNQMERVHYTAKVQTTGGRDGGTSRSSDGRLDIKLLVPGTPGTGTNPEQLFAAGWSTCFLTSIKIVAGRMKVNIPSDLAVDADVDLCRDDSGFLLQARINVSLPGMAHDLAQTLVDEADMTCPYSKATRGNIHVAICVATTSVNLSASAKVA